MSGMFGGGGSKVSTTSPVIAGLQLQTSAYGRAIAWVFGKTRIPANLLWYDDFLAIPHTTTTESGGGGGKGGGGKVVQENTTFTYQAAALMLLCRGGAAVGVTRVWKDKDVTTLADLGMSLFTGTASQAAFSHLTVNHPSDAYTYRSLAYVASAALSLGDNAQLGNHNFEVQGLLPYSGSIPDANIADVLTAVASDPVAGAGVPSALIGDLSQVSDYCVANGIFVAAAFLEPKPAEELLTALTDVANSEVVYSEQKIKVVPYSDEAATGNGVTYTPDATPVFDLDDDDYVFSAGQAPVEFADEDATDACNIVVVKFRDRALDYSDNTVEAKDDDDIVLNGERPLAGGVIDFTDLIVERDVAMVVAYQILRRKLYQRIKYAFRVKPGKFDVLEPMDLLRMSETRLGLSLQTVRVLEIEEEPGGKGMSGYRLTVRECPPGSSTGPLYAGQTASGTSLDFNAAGDDCDAPVIFDAPGIITVSGYELWMAVSGAGAHWGGAQVWVATDPGGPYKQVGVLRGAARHGVLSAPFAMAADPDTTHTCAVNLSISEGTLSGGTQDDADNLTMLCWIEGELISFETASLTSANHYDLKDYIRRGVYHTPVSAHAAGQRFVRVDPALFRYAYDPAMIGKTLYFKLPSFNVYGGAPQDLADVAEYSYTILGSLSRPGDVTGYTASQNGAVGVFQWNIIAEPNIKGYELRYLPKLNRVATEADYLSATPLTRVTRGTQITTAKLPPGDWTTFIKGIDNSERDSLNASTFDITIVSTFDLIRDAQQAPDWLGTKTNFIKHWSGVLVPESTVNANAMTREELFEEYVPYPQAECSYQAPELDLTIDDDTRIWADIQSFLGRGRTGVADPQLEVDYKTAAGSYDGFDPWTIGVVLCRYVKGRFSLTTDDGVCYVSGFRMVADADEREEEKVITVAAGGTAFTFDTPFHLLQRVELFNLDTTAKIPVVITPTNTGFTAKLFNTSNVDVGGQARYVAYGN